MDGNDSWDASFRVADDASFQTDHTTPGPLAVLRKIALRSMLTAALAGILLGPILAGFAPIGGDPAFLYQPLKLELARALSAGRLPYWSDLIGLGVPLVAESHVAAFYPPNWLFYRVWDVATAYRLTMAFHMLALVAATFAYARGLGLSRAGSAMTVVSFALCGFQAAHAVHEPFYHVMPYLPLCLFLADRYARTGGIGWLAFLALAWGIQITLGHFQIQMWTAGLVLLTGGWRAVTATQMKRKAVFRIIGLLVALCWGVAVAWVQLRLTWELSAFAGFVRPAESLSAYSFPPTQCAEFVLPEVFLGRSNGSNEAYWSQNGAVLGEATAYVGIVPLILAFIGAIAAKRSDGLAPWRLIVPLTLVLATMAGWWPDGFAILLQIPGFGWFRAPSRYTLLTSLGLALLAGRASITRSRLAVSGSGWLWRSRVARPSGAGRCTIRAPPISELTLAPTRCRRVSGGRVDLGARRPRNHRLAAKPALVHGRPGDHRSRAWCSLLRRPGRLGPIAPPARRESAATAAGRPAGRRFSRRPADESAGARRSSDGISLAGYCPSSAQLFTRADNDPD